MGCGFARGTATVYHTISKCLDALTAAGVPCAASDNDGRNAYCSILRSAMQKGIAKQAPELLPAFDFLYAQVAYCFFYTAGSAAPVGRCEITDGVQQGEVFGPLFFSLALDVLLSMLRARMLDLPVDSTMIGQTVEVCLQTEGLVEGMAGSVPLQVGTKVMLLEAPHFSAIARHADPNVLFSESTTARYRLRGTRSRLQLTGMPESAWRARRRMRSFKAVLLRMISARRGRPSAASRTLILTLPPLTLSL